MNKRNLLTDRSNYHMYDSLSSFVHWLRAGEKWDEARKMIKDIFNGSVDEGEFEIGGYEYELDDLLLIIELGADALAKDYIISAGREAVGADKP